MQCNKQNLLQFLKESKSIIIPIYQRNYAWKEKQCQQLLDDLILIMKRNKTYTHFFGSTVSCQIDGKKSCYLLIDGQQRIITTSMLLLAIANLLKETPGEINKKLENQIRDDYLMSNNGNDYRLQLLDNDQKAMVELFKNRNELILSSNITKNYLYLKKQIENLDLPSLYEAIKNLIIIDICLETNDDPQVIFEGLNATGLNLTNSDKIKNYIFMDMPLDVQEQCYKNYWMKIEEKTKDYINNFLAAYLTLQLGAVIRYDDVYFKFKDFTKNIDKQDLLKDLLYYADLYQIILNPREQGNTYFQKLNVDEKTFKKSGLLNILIHLNVLNLTVTYPFILNQLDYLTKNKLDIWTVTEILSIVESYIARRLIVGLGSQGFNKFFTTLNAEIEKHIDDNSNYFHTFKKILTEKYGSFHFPTDDELKKSVKENNNIYYFNRSTIRYLFTRLENLNNKETGVTLDSIGSEHNIEHIMPQTLTDEWKKSLGS